jgi:two-component system chemotaxis response regulator CheY
MKILVVDDSTVMRKLIARCIRQAGYANAQLVEAQDGAHALQIAESENPDLILADWNMPELTGIEMLQTLREDGNDVCVGFVTSESSTESELNAQQAGASFLLSKPIDPAKLEAALSATVG